jgi:hypothetical protein
MAFWYFSGYSKDLKRKDKTMNETLYNLHQIQAAFLDDPDMRDYGVKVLDSNGILTLRGTVPAHAAR